jgi:arabinosaccharide transport system substrate-binding protein
MKYKWTIMLLVAIASFLFAQVTWAQTTEIKIWSFGSFTDWLKEVGTAFEKANPDTRVEVEGYPYQQMHDNLLIALQTGVGAPNLATIEIGQVAKFYRGEEIKLLDLTSYLEKSGYKEKIFESRLTPFSFQGAIYGIPFDLTPAAFFYREDVYQEAGINPEAIQTWNDFTEAALKLKNQGKYALQLGNGASANSEFGHFWMWLIQAGGGVFDQEANVILDNDIAKQVLQYYVDAVLKHKIANTSSQDVGSPAWWAPYQASQVVSDFGPDWYIGFLKNNAPNQQGLWRIRPLPAWEVGGYTSSTWGGTMLSVIPASAASDEKALDFLSYALLENRENLISFYKQTGMIPPRKDLVDAEEFDAPDPYFGGQKVARILVDMASQVPPFYLAPTWPEATDLMNRKIILEALQGKDPATVLKEAADELRKLK